MIVKATLMMMRLSCNDDDDNDGKFGCTEIMMTIMVRLGLRHSGTLAITYSDANPGSGWGDHHHLMISDIDIENDHEHHQMINIWSMKYNIWELSKKREKTWWHGWQLMLPSFVLFPRHGCCFYWLYFHPVVVPPLDIFMKASWNGCWLLRSLKGNQPSPLSPLWAER